MKFLQIKRWSTTWFKCIITRVLWRYVCLVALYNLAWRTSWNSAKSKITGWLLRGKHDFSSILLLRSQVCNPVTTINRSVNIAGRDFSSHNMLHSQRAGFLCWITTANFSWWTAGSVGLLNFRFFDPIPSNLKMGSNIHKFWRNDRSAGLLNFTFFDLPNPFNPTKRSKYPSILEKCPKHRYAEPTPPALVVVFFLQ